MAIPFSVGDSDQLKRNSSVGDTFHRQLTDDRTILIRSIAGGQLWQADAVIRRLAREASRLGYAEIGHIAVRAQRRLETVGNDQAMLPYMCQLAVEIDRALADDEHMLGKKTH